MKLSWIFLIGSLGLFASAIVDADDDKHKKAKKQDKHYEQRAHREHRAHRDHREHRVHRERRAHREHREHREHRRHREHREHRVHHNRHHYHDQYRDHKYYHNKRHHYKKHRYFNDYFWGLTYSFCGYGHCSDWEYRHRPKKYFVMNSYGECFKVKRRKHRDIIKEVPRYKCYEYGYYDD